MTDLLLSGLLGGLITVFFVVTIALLPSIFREKKPDPPLYAQHFMTINEVRAAAGLPAYRPRRQLYNDRPPYDYERP